jgi:hypothetical protein
VIDISGDGANNQGRLVIPAWDEAVAQGVTINRLPLMLKQPDGLWDIEDLDLYFRTSVIGGPGAFMIPVREKHQFAGAIRTKVLRGIAEQPRPLVQRPQAEAPTTCLARTPTAAAVGELIACVSRQWAKPVHPDQLTAWRHNPFIDPGGLCLE